MYLFLVEQLLPLGRGGQLAVYVHVEAAGDHLDVGGDVVRARNLLDKRKKTDYMPSNNYNINSTIEISKNIKSYIFETFGSRNKWTRKCSKSEKCRAWLGHFQSQTCSFQYFI